ncbi:MAG: peptidase family, partial [Frankiales bacterium]|nr:peptidase family [Frankiales bacterium]
RNPVGLGVLALIAAISLGWLGGWVHGAYISLDLVELLGLMVFAGAIVVWPLAQPAEGAPPERLLGPALLIVGLGLTAIVRFSDPYSARFPRLAYVQYLADIDAGRAWRIRPQGNASPWSDGVLKTDGGKVEKLQEINAPRDAAAAKFVPQPAPTATSAKQADGSVLVHLAPPPGGQTLIFQLTANTPARIVALAGIPVQVTMAPGKPILGRFVAIPQGLDVTIRPAGPGRLDVVME